jgi:antitoxin YefM
MLTIYQMKASELDERFLKSVKAQYRDRDLEIIVSDFDETEYLLKSEANKKHLLQAIENISKGVNLKVVNLDDLDANSDI